eukprot:384054_1
MRVTSSCICLLTIVYICTEIPFVHSIIVNTTNGAVEGLTDGDVTKFYRIPFAKPPIGNLRFAAPQEPNAWNETIPYPTNPFLLPACMQNCNSPPDSGICPYVISEDCLYLNVFASSNAEYMKTNYTVLIWIYGGSFLYGWGSWWYYDPSNIVSYIDNIIIVTFNYRVGLLGSLYDNTYGTMLNGNYGYLDQKLAIKWVNRNIKYFGGNENNVLLFGESAGAMSISLHLLYNNDGYFKSAIMQSNVLGMEYRTPAKWYDVPLQFSKAIGCENVSADKILNCWRNVSADIILTAQLNPLLIKNWNALPFAPTVETDLLLQQPIFAFQ